MGHEGQEGLKGPECKELVGAKRQICIQAGPCRSASESIFQMWEMILVLS